MLVLVCYFVDIFTKYGNDELKPANILVVGF